MNKFSLFLMIVGGTCVFNDSWSQDLASKSKRIFGLARQGYLEENPALLLDAVDLLLKHPQIRKMDGGAEKDPSAKSYFGLKTLFADAERFTPFDAKKKLRRRLEKTRKKVARFDYETMGAESSGSWVDNDNYFIAPNNPWSSTRQYGRSHIHVSIREGEGLKLAVYDALGKLLKKDYSENEEKKVSLALKKDGPIKIVVENLSAEAIDAHLMIEINQL